MMMSLGKYECVCVREICVYLRVSFMLVVVAHEMVVMMMARWSQEEKYHYCTFSGGEVVVTGKSIHPNG